jgi:diguanylate cyclase (GGDEF)-like protein
MVGRVAGGDLDAAPIAPARVDEIRDLADGVATMTAVLGDRIRVAAEREDELVRRSGRLERVLELSRGLAESLSLRYTTMRLLDAVRSLSGAELAELWLRARDKQELVRYDVTGAGGTVAIDPDADTCSEPGSAVELGIGAIGRAARYGRAIALDERHDSRTPDAHRAGTAIPLVVGSQVIGVLSLRPPAGAELDLDMIDGLILQGASALQAAQLHSDVEERSRKDALTGLANRRQFDEDLAANVGRATRYGHDLSLIMIDLDHFKQINDLYGHLRGDEVLQDVAAIIDGSVRGADTAYRYGGEELCVLLPETPAEEACALADRVRQQVEKSFPWASESAVTLSAGVAALEKDGDGPRLVGAADRALYAAKRNGRNRVVCDGS